MSRPKDKVQAFSQIDSMISTLVGRGMGKAVDLRALGLEEVTRLYSELKPLTGSTLVSTHQSIQNEGDAARQFARQTREEPIAHQG